MNLHIAEGLNQVTNVSNHWLGKAREVDGGFRRW